MSAIAGVILAAGEANRMGRPKQLLRARGRTLLDGVLQEALQSDLDCVVLVLGAYADTIRRSLSTNLHHPKLHILINNRYKEGLSTSLITGLLHIEEAYDHVLILLADMPFVTKEAINRLIRGYGEAALPLAAIGFRGRRSHPVLIHRTFFPELRRLTGDRGAREVFRRHEDRVCLVRMEETYSDGDIDTREEYEAYLQLLEEKEGSPLPESAEGWGGAPEGQ